MDKTEFVQLRRSIAANSIDKLLELLSSDDLKTRFCAEMALRDKTAT